MSKTGAGVRVGRDFLWIEVDRANLARGGQHVPIITARDATMGGDIFARSIATRDMAKQLRIVADTIDEMCRDAETEEMT